MSNKRRAVFALAVVLVAALLGCRNRSDEGGDVHAAVASRDTTVTERQPERAAAVTNDSVATNAARLIAGMVPFAGSGMDSLVRADSWREYHRISDEVWRTFLADKYAGVRQFAEMLPDSLPKGKPVLYPFSGPDFLYVHAMFPDAGTYVMFGLESPGVVPDLGAVTVAEVTEVTQAAAASIEEILSCSFFRTIDMRTELATDHLEGTLPIVLQLAVRTGHNIVGVRYFALDPAGDPVYQVVPTTGDVAKGSGFELALSGAGDDSTRHTVVYLCCDVSDGGLAGNGERVKKFLERMDAPKACYIKAASYLMHKSYFATIRSLILAKSDLIVQDDSGIPYRLFTPETWIVHLYGSYTGPIDMFKDHKQDDLLAAYAAGTPDLGVRFGYLRHSAVQVAVRARGR